MSQKRIITTILIMVIALVIGGMMYYAFLQKDSVISPRESTRLNITDEMKDWDIFRDDVVFNFEIKYPPDWHQSIHGPNLVLSVTNDLNSPTFIVRGIDGYSTLSKEEVFDGDRETKIDFQKECSNITFSGVSAYECRPEEEFYVGKRNVIFPNDGIFYIISDGIQNDVTEKIFSTFKFVR